MRTHVRKRRPARRRSTAAPLWKTSRPFAAQTTQLTAGQTIRPQIQRKCGCGGACPKCSARREAQGTSVGGKEGSGILSSVYSALRSSGQPLDPCTRNYFESRFDREFGSVRLHTDRTAAESAGAIGAKAYTVGRHMVFGKGQYAPSTSEGKSLMAHELAHVVQQGAASSIPGSGLSIDPASSGLEAEADTAARAVDSGVQPAGLSKAGVGISRTEAEEATCPATFTIENDVYDGMVAAWAKSGHGTKTATEHAGLIVETAENGETNRAIREGAGEPGSKSMPVPESLPGDTVKGLFHTHPYSTKEGSHLGVSFSPGDVTRLIKGDVGDVFYVWAGNCAFVLSTADKTKRDACNTQVEQHTGSALDPLKNRFIQSWGTTGRAGGSFQEKTEAGLKAMIDGCGLCYYSGCQLDPESPVPKALNLNKSD